MTRHEPPHRKTWETVGTPNFWIVGQYQYDVQIEPQGNGSMLNVTFDFSPPKESGWLKLLLSRIYGRICAWEMVQVTSGYFERLRKVKEGSAS